MRRILSGPGRFFQFYLQNSKKRPQKKVYILCASLLVCEISLRSLRLGTVFNCLYNLKDMQFTFVIIFLVYQDVMFDLQGLHTALPEIACVVGNPF